MPEWGAEEVQHATEQVKVYTKKARTLRSLVALLHRIHVTFLGGEPSTAASMYARVKDGTTMSTEDKMAMKVERMTRKDLRDKGTADRAAQRAV